jgi:hypothetical protein
MLCLKPRCAELACFALKLLIFKEKTGPDSRRKHCYAEQSGLTDTTANQIIAACGCSVGWLAAEIGLDRIGHCRCPRAGQGPIRGAHSGNEQWNANHRNFCLPEVRSDLPGYTTPGRGHVFRRLQLSRMPYPGLRMARAS